MKIRHATENDIAKIQHVVQLTWPVTYGEILSSEQIAYMLEKMYSSDKLLSQLKEGHIFLLAEDESGILGFAGIELHYLGRETTRLHKIYVLPSAQGKKVGISLVKEIVDISKAENQTIINLNVNRYNKARNFYEKLGFEVIRDEDIDIGNGFLMEDHVMELKL